VQESGQLCPQHKFAPRDSLEYRAARVANSEGVWRWEWRDAKDSAGEIGRRRYPTGIQMREAIARCPVDDEAEAETLVSYFQSIENGALTGANIGWESERERAEEDGEV